MERTDVRVCSAARSKSTLLASITAVALGVSMVLATPASDAAMGTGAGTGAGGGVVGGGGPSAPWTDANFVLAWGVLPVEGETSMTLLADERFLRILPDGGVAGAGGLFELQCPDVYLLGLQTGPAASGAAGGGADGGEGGVAGADAHAEFDAFGTFSDVMIVPIPFEHASVVVDAVNPDFGDVTATYTEMWIAGTLIGTSGIPQHVSGLLGLVLIEGDGVPDGIVGTMLLNPHQSWSRIEDAHLDLWLIAELYASLDVEEEDGADERRDPPVVQPDELSCQQQRAAGMWACTKTRTASRAACLGAFSRARVAADAQLAACLNSISIADRLVIIGSMTGIGACLGGTIGVCVGAAAGGVGAVPGGGIGAWVGGCVGGLVGLAGGGAILRADCRAAHRGALAAAVVIRDACLADAAAAYATCVDQVKLQYQICIAAGGGN